MPLPPSVKASVERKLEEYEGRYNHLYLDTAGKVTVGIGHLISNRASIASVLLYKSNNGTPSTPATLTEKLAEYDRIAKQPRNYRAAWYKQFCTLIMREGDIDLQRNHHVSSFYKELTTIYTISNGYKSSFDQMPPEVQMALFDMIFNLGATRLRTIFLNFNNAVKNNDWHLASVESNRPDVSLGRNTYVKQLLLKAHKNSQKTTP